MNSRRKFIDFDAIESEGSIVERIALEDNYEASSFAVRMIPYNFNLKELLSCRMRYRSYKRTIADMLKRIIHEYKINLDCVDLSAKNTKEVLNHIYRICVRTSNDSEVGKWLIKRARQCSNCEKEFSYMFADC